MLTSGFLKVSKKPISFVLFYTACTSFDLEFSLTIRQQRYVRDIYNEIQQESLRDKIAIESIFYF